MTCPLPGKCVHDRVGTKGEHSCTAGRCPHARLVRMALGEQIQAICRKGQRTEREEERLERLKKEFEPKGIPVYPISAVSGKGLKELLYAVQKKLDELPKERMVFEQEFFPEDMLLAENLPYTVEQDPEDEHRFIIEGPKIEKMLGYTNLDSEKGFAFFQRFLKDTGILDELEQAGIQEGDTVKMYGFEFDYYK